MPRPSRQELLARGVELRKKCQRRAHAVWKAPANRPDPVQLVEEGNQGRIPQLLPIRHGRMIQSPFTHYRGSALAMFGLTCVTVVVQALGTLEAITILGRKWQTADNGQRFLASEIQVVHVVSILLFLHLVEAGAWAGVYWFAGLLPDLEAAIYFSITSYTTVGYGDVVLPATWRLLGPMEAAVGILMFGWSTGVMVTALAKIYRSRL